MWGKRLQNIGLNLKDVKHNLTIQKREIRIFFLQAILERDLWIFQILKAIDVHGIYNRIKPCFVKHEIFKKSISKQVSPFGKDWFRQIEDSLQTSGLEASLQTYQRLTRLLVRGLYLVRKVAYSFQIKKKSSSYYHPEGFHADLELFRFPVCFVIHTVTR